ncbi:hypothetical protein HOO54_06395 [Bacillus sp. WMMC1349]|uniref:hypothetical protein n=1 Tax=Bacillus sp. WMMC1349 TaxID=2736254 RepID=UPI001554B7E7|nr:hypothetical protein [Bacillus sp. WMMC1349]NPC91872.1 hypothetical protein [Bacillus sp. WMMC1349]
MKLDKLLYLMVHIVMPFVFFIAFFLWGHFYLSKPIWENITDNLSIIGIYYMLVSFFWFININNIRSASQEIEQKKRNL